MGLAFPEQQLVLWVSPWLACSPVVGSRLLWAPPPVPPPLLPPASAIQNLLLKSCTSDSNIDMLLSAVSVLQCRATDAASGDSPTAKSSDGRVEQGLSLVAGFVYYQGQGNRARLCWGIPRQMYGKLLRTRIKCRGFWRSSKTALGAQAERSNPG